jgi:hypothetical protein
MIELTENLWIILDTGLVIFTYLEEESVNPDLFGGLISVLDNFAESILKGGLEFFEIDPNIYGVIKKHHLIFLASSSQKLNIIDLISEVEIITRKFFTLYPSDIKEKWDGNRDYFNSFKSEINSLRNL